VDLIFTFFTKYFNTAKVIKIMPLITSLGLALYALIPTFFPKYAYLGFLVGTLIFSVAAGLSEVLLSPVIAAIPSDNPQRNMSNLHSLYAFGVFSVVCDIGIDEYLLPDINILNGYTGELYTEDRLIADGINFVGCPIILNPSADEEKLYFDLEQTDIQSSSWFSSYDDVSIEYDNSVKCSKKNPFPKGSPQHGIYEGYVSSLCSADGLICELSISEYKDFEKLKKSVFRYI
jgi:hypothetical protein